MPNIMLARSSTDLLSSKPDSSPPGARVLVSEHTQEANGELVDQHK